MTVRILNDIPRLKCDECKKIVDNPAGANNTEHVKFCYHLVAESGFVVTVDSNPDNLYQLKENLGNGKYRVVRCDGGKV